MEYPKMMRIRQKFNAPVVEDIVATVKQELATLTLGEHIRPGQTVAITVGSRGIANLPLIIKTLVDELKALGAEPFVVPAMGSHGGGTAEGQKRIVESYGITEAYTGAPIRSSMEVVQVGATPEGVPVYCDRFAYEADHVAVVNRVKLHTDFFGDIQSGLHKMMLIGLGKHHGAITYHKAIMNYSFGHIVKSVGEEFIRKCKVLLGLGIVENQRHETAIIKAIAPQDMQEKEKELLKKAVELMPKLPFEQVDLLIVDEMGKNVSGAGMDTTVVGRKYHDNHADEKETPKVTRIYVRSLTPETHGNAAGIGTADYAHSRIAREMDYEATYINCNTGFHPSGGQLPIHYDTDRRVLREALATVGLVEPQNARVVRIRNTQKLTELLVSEAYAEEVKSRSDLEILEDVRDMEFDEVGDLKPQRI